MTKTYIITASAYMHQNLFQRTETADLLLVTLFRYRDAGEFLVHEFVVMPNHLHLLLSVDDDHAIGRAVQMIKGGFSFAMGEGWPEIEGRMAAKLLRTSGARHG